MKSKVMWALSITVAIFVAAWCFWPSTSMMASSGVNTKIAALMTPEQASNSFSNLPLYFEPNKGQLNNKLDYLAKGIDYQVGIASTKNHFFLFGADKKNNNVAHIESELLKANPHAKAVSEGKMPGVSNYYVGNNPKQWHAGINHFEKVRYQQVYPGIDVVYYGKQHQLEYDFLVQAQANPEQIVWQYSGAKQINVDNDGNLRLKTALGEIQSLKPIAYQDVNGQRKYVDARYHVINNQVSFILGDYDKQHDLVIDPVIVYSTYLGSGGKNTNQVVKVTSDSNGNIYLVGFTLGNAAEFPINDYFFSKQASAFIMKLSSDGKTLLSSTYLGSATNLTSLADIVVDEANNALFVAGYCAADDYPLIAPDPADAKPRTETGVKTASAVLSKLSMDTQQLLFSTYLTGEKAIVAGSTTASAQPGLGSINSLALDKSGGVYVIGQTTSPWFPVSIPMRIKDKPQNDTSSLSMFLGQFNGQGKRLWSRVFGGSKDELGFTLAVNSSNELVVAGITTSSDMDVTGDAYRPQMNVDATQTQVQPDVYLAKFSSDGTTLLYGTYFGGAQSESSALLKLGSDDSIWVAGNTSSTANNATVAFNFPLLNAYNSTPASFISSNQTLYITGYLAKFSSAGQLQMSTYLRASEVLSGYAVDAAGTNVWTTGYTLVNYTPSNPLSYSGFTSPSDEGNAFLSHYATSGPSLSFLSSTSLPLSSGLTVAFDSFGALYWGGQTSSDKFPLVNQLSAMVKPTTFVDQTGASQTGSQGFLNKIQSGPLINLQLTPKMVIPGASSTLAWSTSSDAVSCRNNSAPEASLSGSKTVTAQSTPGNQTFFLFCKNAANEESAATATLRVADVPKAYIYLSKVQLIEGDSVTVLWNSIDASTCTLTGEGVSNTGATSGSQSVTISTAGTKTYSVACSGPAGNSAVTPNSQASIEVYPKPVITASWSVPAIDLGQSATFQWSANYASTCNVARLDPSNAAYELRGDSINPNITGSKGVQPIKRGAYTVAIQCVDNKDKTTAVVKTYDLSVLYPITLTTGATAVQPNKPLAVSWLALDYQSCQASGDWSGMKDVNTDKTETLTFTTEGTKTLTLMCQKSGVQKTTSVNVLVSNTPLPTVSLQASVNQVTLGQSVQITWSSTNATSCAASGGWSGSQSLTGSISYTPITVSKNPLVLTCIGPAGSQSSQVPFSVLPSNASPSTSSSSGGALPFISSLGILALALSRRRKKIDWRCK